MPPSNSTLSPLALGPPDFWPPILPRIVGATLAAHLACLGIIALAVDALAHAGRRAEAIEQFEGALKIRSDDPKTHNNLGIVLASVGRTDEAMAQFREALRLEPAFAEAHFNLALTLRQEGRADEAATEFSASGRPIP